jgi:hypothetical protein
MAKDREEAEVLALGSQQRSEKEMNRDSTDFMITEYDKIASAYFGLRDQVNEWFKAYLTLVGLPLTVLAAVTKIGEGGISTSLTSLPDVVAALLILVSFLGFFVTLSIIAMRMEMILYARTINGVRRYFGELDAELPRYFILPTSDSLPPFYEAWRAMFWQVILIGFMDGIISIVGIQSLLKWGWALSILAGLAFILLHFIVYRFSARRNEKGWRTRFPKGLSPSQI